MCRTEEKWKNYHGLKNTILKCLIKSLTLFSLYCDWLPDTNLAKLHLFVLLEMTADADINFHNLLYLLSQKNLSVLDKAFAFKPNEFPTKKNERKSSIHRSISFRHFISLHLFSNIWTHWLLIVYHKYVCVPITSAQTTTTTRGKYVCMNVCPTPLFGAYFILAGAVTPKCRQKKQASCVSNFI